MAGLSATTKLEQVLYRCSLLVNLMRWPELGGVGGLEVFD